MAFPFVYCQLAGFYFSIVLLHATIAAAAPANFVIRTNPGNETDRIALLAFKQKISQDPDGVMSSWNLSKDFCEWEGITCSRRHRRVTMLNLRSRRLVGSLSPYIGNLSFLREIRLENNTLHGEIPEEVGRLFRLRFLYLGNNSLVGQIPVNLSHCSKLSFLHLGWNKLVGKFPLEFASLSNLKELAIHFNHLTGGIPPFLANISSLEALSASYNAFGGNIPDSLGQLRYLTSLGLGGNNISGTIPPSLYNLSSLAIFSLSENRLRGRLPSNLGLTLPNLRRFQISVNFFSGSIPVSLSNASKLEFIEMVGNNLSGKLSVDFGGMQQLSYLNLGRNDLGSGEPDEMRFIDSLANCSNLQDLDLSVNRFQGVLPHSFGNLSTQLLRLLLDSNQLYGTIPSGVGNLVNLYLFAIGWNQFTGKIPAEIGKLHNLQWMDLHRNKLSEEIPPTLGNLSSLLELHLLNNNLQGTIPTSLGKLRNLAALDLSRNDLWGTIPETLFHKTPRMISLNLSQNHLVGKIPPSIADMKNLMRLDVSRNNLSGEIPLELSNCGNLEILHMEGNFFQGSIPPALSSLEAIRQVDLARNNLSGKIPKFLESLALRYLNLSFNDFEGEVPVKGVFTNASAMSVVGNTRLCGGIHELQLPKCNINNSSKKQKDSLAFKVIISISCAFMGIAMVAFLMFCWFKRRREKQSPSPMLRKTLLKLSYEKLLKATDGFSSTNLIGLGSFGSVYKGVLDQDGLTIAVKVLNLQRQGASKSFMAECKALTKIRHRNLVKIITSCSSVDFQGNDFKALIYEFMPNGSLENWLHPASEGQQAEIPYLSLRQRIEIGIDVASALDYLHHHCQQPILHCDLKPSNILLDSNMTAHVGDFGLAKFLQEHSNPTQSSSLGIRGTIGYAAPEYGLGSEVSADGDVYSYGILLLEMMTGKKPTDEMFDGGLNLHKFARMALANQVMDIVDPTLLNNGGELAAENNRLRHSNSDRIKECLISVIRIGVACSMESPQERMEISNAVSELQMVKKALVGPPTRPYIQTGG
ncbi:PREDICTED: probable LRR receptor-like serine/threonine-protein kinase At3g47570 [Theobroma cacao]|uniref:non-specific serine/threonine protein kinase n=1 Tax=Theobroma cacao TaxID=3641 RepID=A0AB32X2L5_THECC|nr:PREDICTED: probable LRR receptor-like serine/threonine-protein kinase At3g47570 [Theobroma cacao]